MSEPYDPTVDDPQPRQHPAYVDPEGPIKEVKALLEELGIIMPHTDSAKRCLISFVRHNIGAFGNTPRERAELYKRYQDKWLNRDVISKFNPEQKGTVSIVLIRSLPKIRQLLVGVATGKLTHPAEPFIAYVKWKKPGHVREVGFHNLILAGAESETTSSK